MGKKGNWLSALKRVFNTTSKDKPSAFTPEQEQRPARESKKKWAIGKTKHEGDTSGRFFHLQRGPSSVEKILGDAERETQRANLLLSKRPHDAYQHHQQGHHRHLQQQQQQQHHYSQPYQHKLYHQQHEQKPQHARHQNQTHQQKPQNRPQLLLPPQLPLPRASIPPSALAARTPVWPLAQRRFTAAAIRIQAAYRGHRARQGYRALRGLVRLQVVMRGQGVRRQTASALRSTQTLVRVQAQVRRMRLQMAENRNTLLNHNRLQQQEPQKLYLAAGPAAHRDGGESILSKWSAVHQAAAERHQSGWDDSLLPREEIQARVQRKVEAIAKRERALAYHYNQQQFKASPISAYSSLAETKHGGLPVWWGWVENQKNHHHNPADSPFTTTTTPVTASYYMRHNQPTATENHSTPAASRPSSRPATSKPRRSGAFQAIRDDESLTSCPPVPSYMAPTVSAKAKVREAPSPTPAPAKRRFSFGLTSSLWGGGRGASSLFSGKGKGKEAPPSRPQSVAGKRRHRSARSIGDISIDSTLSLPVGVGKSALKE